MPKIKTVLLAADVSPLAEPALYASAYRAVQDTRRRKTDRFVYPKDRYLSLGAGILLRYALRSRGIREDAEISYSEHGKPFLKEHGEVHFNLSHSGVYALCAVSDFAVGCDIEGVATPRLSLAKRFFSPKEYEMLAALTDMQAQTDRFYRLWTLRESVLKATGKGFSMPSSSFTVLFDQNDCPYIAQEPFRSEYKFTEFDVSPDYRCAVCVQNPNDSVTFRTLLLTDIL